MALNGQSTSNFDLYKPSLSDSPPDITSTNKNWDTIDKELKRLGDIGLPSNVNKKLPTIVASTEIKEIYISTTGNDLSDGTVDNPLKTISAAIGRFGGTARLRLNFSAGTYTETNAINVSGCASVELVGTEDMSVTLNVEYHQYGGYFEASNISFVSASDAVNNTITFYGATVRVEKCTFNVKKVALSFRYGSQGLVLNDSFNNCGDAIYAMGGSVVSAHEITGSGNTRAYYAVGGLIMLGTSTVEATTLATKIAGGIIFRGGNLIGSTANTFVNAT